MSPTTSGRLRSAAFSLASVCVAFSLLAASTARAAGAPLASITAPADGSSVGYGQSWYAQVSCSQGTDTTAITSCKIVESIGGATSTWNHSSAYSGSQRLYTGTAGTATLTVTATASDGASDAASVTFDIVQPPTATIASPANYTSYPVGESVPVAFSCQDASGPGIASCTDSNGAASGAGQLDTSTAGTFNYTVTALSLNGVSNTTTYTYSVYAAQPSTEPYTVADSQDGTVAGASAVAFDPSARLLAVVSGSGSVNLLSVSATGTASAAGSLTPPRGGTVREVAFSPDGGFLAVAGGDYVSLYTVTGAGTVGYIGDMTHTGGPIYGLAFTSNDLVMFDLYNQDWVLVVSPDQFVPDGTGVGVPSSYTGPTGINLHFNTSSAVPGPMAFSSADDQLAVLGFYEVPNGSSVQLFAVNTATGALTSEGTTTVGGTATGMALNPAGTLLAVADQTTDSVQMYSIDPTSGAQTLASSTSTGNLTSPAAAAFSPDGSRLVVANSAADDVAAYGVSGDGSLSSLGAAQLGSLAQPGALAFSGDGSLLASANTGDGTFSLLTVSAPTATIGSPASGGTYSVGQDVPVSFSCADAAAAPGVASCTDSNGVSGGTGALDTSTVGTHTYTVTAVSADGQTGTATINYTVSAAQTTSVAPAPAARAVLTGRRLVLCAGTRCLAPKLKLTVKLNLTQLPGTYELRLVARGRIRGRWEQRTVMHERAHAGRTTVRTKGRWALRAFPRHSRLLVEVKVGRRWRKVRDVSLTVVHHRPSSQRKR